MLAKHLKIILVYSCSLPFFSVFHSLYFLVLSLFCLFFSPPPQATFTLSRLGQSGSLHVT